MEANGYWNIGAMAWMAHKVIQYGVRVMGLHHTQRDERILDQWDYGLDDKQRNVNTSKEEKVYEVARCRVVMVNPELTRMPFVDQ